MTMNDQTVMPQSCGIYIEALRQAMCAPGNVCPVSDEVMSSWGYYVRPRHCLPRPYQVLR